MNPITRKPRIINYAFINSQNLNIGVKAQGWRLDHKKFKSYLQSCWHVTKSYLFIGYIEEQEDMYKKLRQMGFTIVFKPTVMHGDEVKGNVDAELVLQVMKDWNSYREAVVISGDGDFYSLFQHLIKEHKLATLIIPNQRRYSSLYNEIPKKHIHFMNDLRAQLNYQPQRAK